ncbi:hypothetical protein N0V88_000333 [Collariella sp. IMI 366227]|nr:hypothetical protein N0V88_000333 [Collariella sp. IMI 366227]
MQSSDPEHFFETDAAQEKRARRAAKANNKYGNPINLKSKILAAIPTPLTLLRRAGRRRLCQSLTCARVGGRDLLISGGADKKIMVWDVETGRRLYVMQDVEGDDEFAGHETTVYKVVLDQEGDDGDVDLWTASGDGTVKCLSRAKGFKCEDTFHHGDHVRALAVTEQWVITAGRDEDIKFWDRASGKLYCALVGHYDEVTELVVMRNPGGAAERLCSVSIDGTVRTWPLAKAGLDAAVQEQEKPVEEEKKEEVGEGLLSAEEEAELAALMEDDDE